MYTCPSMSYVHIGTGCVEARAWLLSHLIHRYKPLSQTWGLPIWLPSLASILWDSLFLHSNVWSTARPPPSPGNMGFWGSKLRSSCFCGECFPHEPALHPLLPFLHKFSCSQAGFKLTSDVNFWAPASISLSARITCTWLVYEALGVVIWDESAWQASTLPTQL